MWNYEYLPTASQNATKNVEHYGKRMQGRSFDIYQRRRTKVEDDKWHRLASTSQSHLSTDFKKEHQIWH